MNNTIRLAREHNTRALIHRNLSNENICDIFLALSQLDVPSLARPQGWYLQVNGVCHLWREIAVNYAELWAHSAGSFPTKRMTDVAVHRARAVDLSFDGHFEDLEGSGYVLTEYQLSLVEEHAARLRSFVHDDYMDWSHVFYRLKSFPRLEMARIWDDSGPDMWHELIEAPRLRTLYMNNVLVPFHASSLRYLRIDMDNPDWRLTRDVSGLYEPVTEGCQAIPRVFPTQAFIAFLQCSPRLERLVVTDMPLLLSERLPSAFKLHAELPHLRALHLGGKSQAMGDLWHRLSIPQDAQFFIDIDSLDDVVLLEEVRARLDSEVYDSLRLGMTPSCDLLLQTWSSEACMGALDLLPSLGLDDSLHGPAFTLRLPVGGREEFMKLIYEIRDNVSPVTVDHDPVLKFQSHVAGEFHRCAQKILEIFKSPTMKYLDITDLPFSRRYRINYRIRTERFEKLLDHDAYLRCFFQPDGNSVTRVELAWSLIRRISTATLLDIYIPSFEEELLIVDFPCAALPNQKRYDEVVNENAWSVLYKYLEARRKSGWPPLALTLAESLSDMSNMERSEDPMYVHTAIEWSYEDAVKAVTYKGYQRIAEFVTSFEDLRVNICPEAEV